MQAHVKVLGTARTSIALHCQRDSIDSSYHPSKENADHYAGTYGLTLGVTMLTHERV